MGRKLVHTLADLVMLAAIAGDRGAGGCRSWPGAIAGRVFCLRVLCVFVCVRVFLYVFSSCVSVFFLCVSCAFFSLCVCV